MAEKIRDEIHAFQKIEDLEKRVEALETAAAESASLQYDVSDAEEETE